MTTLLVLALYLIGSQSNAKYVIDYDQFVTADIIAYPLDICLAIAFLPRTLQGIQYATFNCNDEGTMVIKTTYGTDSTCTTSMDIENITNTSLFNCYGDPDYTIVRWDLLDTNDTTSTTCCDESMVLTYSATVATNVCFQTKDLNYSMYVLYTVVI